MSSPLPLADKDLILFSALFDLRGLPVEVLFFFLIKDLSHRPFAISEKINNRNNSTGLDLVRTVLAAALEQIKLSKIIIDSQNIGCITLQSEYRR